MKKNNKILNIEHLMLTLDIIHDALIAIDCDERIILFNKSSEKFFGYSNAEVLGKHIDFLFLRSIKSALKKSKDEPSIDILKSHDTVLNAEMVGQHSNGSLFLCKLIIKMDADFHNTFITVSLSEVNKIKREYELKESETRYRRLFESAKDGILILNAKNGMIDDVNPFLINLLGYSKDDFISKNIWDIGPFKDIVANKEKFLDLQQNEYVRYDDLPLETINGNKVYVEFVSNVYLVNNEKVIQCNIRDITKRKQAVSDLHEKDIKYSNLANSGVALIWTTDTSKLCNYFNQPWLKFTGRTLEQELRNGWTEGVHPNDIDNCMKVFVSSFDKRELFDIEYRLKNAEGKYVWIRDLGTPIYDSHNEFLGYIGHCFDISEKKITEMELTKAKEKAEESDRLKTSFLQNMSHEIRTPLNGIIGFSTLLNSENITGVDIKEFTSIIISSGRRLIEIVNNILDISKIQTGQISVDLKPVLLNELFVEMQSFFEFTAKDKQIDLKYVNKNNIDTTILSDQAKIRQILTNLINNAIKFTHQGEITFGFEINKDDVLIYVKDTGIGIPPENQKIVFERFVQSEQELSRNYEGAGLGLAICKGLVEILGGRILLFSEVGVGTTLSFTLPYKLENDINNSVLKKEDKMLGKLSGMVLIVEDDDISERFLSKLLANSGLILLHRENGRKAYECASKIPDIDLILMDVRMPVMDGIEATRLIKRMRPDLPIIAQTAYSFSVEIEKILSTGFDDYIIKPIESDKLFEILEKYLKPSTKMISA